MFFQSDALILRLINKTIQVWMLFCIKLVWYWYDPISAWLQLSAIFQLWNCLVLNQLAINHVCIMEWNRIRFLLKLVHLHTRANMTAQRIIVISTNQHPTDFILLASACLLSALTYIMCKYSQFQLYPSFLNWLTGLKESMMFNSWFEYSKIFYGVMCIQESF